MRRAWRVTAALATVLAAASLVLSAWLFKLNADRAGDIRDQAIRVNAALCTFRGDLESRVRSGEAFLRDHPHGFPGVPAATLRASLVNQQRTVAALAGLPCAKADLTR